MKSNDSVAAGACMRPRKHRMQEACNSAAQHSPAKAQRVATMLKVRLTNGSGVSREQPANGSKCHAYGPPRFGLSGRAAGELSHDRSRPTSNGIVAGGVVHSSLDPSYQLKNATHTECISASKSCRVFWLLPPSSLACWRSYRGPVLSIVVDNTY